MLTKGAIGNLINRYRAVLKKCNLINTFGSLAVASMLVLGGAGVASADIDTSALGNDIIADGQVTYIPFTGNPNEGSFDDFMTKEKVAEQLGNTWVVGHSKTGSKYSHPFNNGEMGALIFGGRYSGVAAGSMQYSDVTSVSLSLAPNATIAGELNLGGLAVGERTDFTKGVILDGKSYHSKVGEATLTINGGVLRPIGADNNIMPGAGGYTVIRGGGASFNNAKSSVGTANIEIKGGGGNSVPNLIYTSIYGGGTNGGYYIRDNNTGEDVKIGYYLDDNNNRIWYNTTGTANIDIKNMVKPDDIISKFNLYDSSTSLANLKGINAAEKSWLGSTIYGGGDNCYVGTANIDLKNSTVATLFAGGECNGVTGEVNITLQKSAILDFYTGARNVIDREPGERHNTSHDGLVGNVTLSMDKHSSVHTWSDQIFQKATSTGSGTLNYKTDGFKTWDMPVEVSNPSGAPARFILDPNSKGYLYLNDEKFNSAYATSAQATVDDATGKGQVTVVMTGKRDTLLGADNSTLVPESTTFSLRNRATPPAAEEIKDNSGRIEAYVYGSTSAGTAAVASVDGSGNAVKNLRLKHLNGGANTYEAPTLHLTGVAEMNDLSINAEDEGSVAGIISHSYSTTELLTSGTSTNAIENVRIDASCTLRLGNTSQHSGGTISSNIRLADWDDRDGSSNLDVIAGRFTLKELRAGEQDIVTVGSPSKSAKLILGTASKLGGATVFLDPNWTKIPTEDVIKNASHLVSTITDSSNKGTIEATYIVGRNSVLTLAGAADATESENKTYAFFNDFYDATKDVWGDWDGKGITAAASILAPHKIAATPHVDAAVPNPYGCLIVDGNKNFDNGVSAQYASANEGSAHFANRSLLMVDSTAATGGNVALTGVEGLATSILKVESGAHIYISDVTQAGDTYSIATGFADYELGNGGWDEENARFTDKLVGKVGFENDTLVINVIEKVNKEVALSVLPKNAFYAFSSDSQESGAVFFDKATRPENIPNASDRVAIINEAARPSVVAGVQNTALRLADAASNTVLDHMSLAQHDGSKAIHADGVDFWAAPIYGNLYSSGMNVAGNSVRGQFGGLALGADMEAANALGGKARVGAAISGGGGQSEAKGTVSNVQNDYGFGAFNLYANWNKADFNVMATVGYNFGNHDIDMYLPAALGMGKGKADIDTSAITADLRAEYQLKTDWVDVLPHAGMRYTALRTGRHDLKVGGSVLNSTDADTQHIVQFPVGVTLSKDFAFADWNVKPSADISFIPAVGDKDMTSTVRFSGVDAVDSFDSRVMDSSSWAATLGVQAEKGNMSFGLNYGVQTSSHETNQNVQFKLGWKF